MFAQSELPLPIVIESPLQWPPKIGSRSSPIDRLQFRFLPETPPCPQLRHGTFHLPSITQNIHSLSILYPCKHFTAAMAKKKGQRYQGREHRENRRSGERETQNLPFKGFFLLPDIFSPLLMSPIARCWDLGHCDRKRCSGQKLMREGLIRSIPLDKKFNGVVIT